MIGSKRMRKRAKELLKCELVGSEDSCSWYRVWGGENHHIVKKDESLFICDCNAYKEHGVCSHVIKVMLVIDPHIFISETIPPSRKTIKHKLRKAGVTGLQDYKRAKEVIYFGKKYSKDTEEIIAERVYQYLKGGR